MLANSKPIKASKRKARKERLLDELESNGVVLDHDARCHVTQRRLDQRALQFVDADEPQDVDADVPLPQVEAGPSATDPDTEELTVASEAAESEEAQFSDAEDGPPTPCATTRSAMLEDENASFELSGVVAADAWQADR